MARHTRIQGLIITDHKNLLIRGYDIPSGRSFWIIPGGGLEAGESEEDCVIREIRVETGLDVRVEKLLIEQEAPSQDIYKNLKSYLCISVGGHLESGSEPEDENFEIAALRWFDLRDERNLSSDLIKGPYTYPHRVIVRQLLGYTTKT